LSRPSVPFSAAFHFFSHALAASEEPDSQRIRAKTRARGSGESKRPMENPGIRNVELRLMDSEHQDQSGQVRGYSVENVELFKSPQAKPNEATRRFECLHRLNTKWAIPRRLAEFFVVRWQCAASGGLRSGWLAL
jgi:hypothetical protein